MAESAANPNERNIITMNDNEQGTTQQQQVAGTITYTVPLQVSINLDTDEQFRGFSAEERTAAVDAVAKLIALVARQIISETGPSVSTREPSLTTVAA